MNITVLGATGRTGFQLVRLLEKNHHLTVLVRDPDKIKQLKLAPQSIITGNVLNKNDLLQAIPENTDLVISCLSTDKNNTLSKMASHLIEHLEQIPEIRFIGIGTAGILDARYETGKFRFESNESKRSSTTAAEDHLFLYQAMKRSQLNWTIICPTYLPEDNQIRPVKYALNRLPKEVRRIGTASLANFTVENLQNRNFLKQRVGVGEVEK